MKKIWELLELKQKKLFISLFVFNIFVVLLELVSLSSVFPIIYSLNNDLQLLEQNKIIVQVLQLLENYEYHPVTFFLIFLALILIFKNLILAIYFYLESKFVFETQEEISTKLFTGLINKDYTFHLNNNSADLVTRVRTDGLVIRDVIFSLQKLLNSLFFLIAIFFFLLFIDPRGFILAFTTFTTLGLLFFKFSSKKVSKLGEIRQEVEIERTKKLQESFIGIKDIKTFLKMDLFESYYRRLAAKISKVYYMRAFISKLPKVFLEVLIVIVVILLTIFLISDSRQNSEIIAILSIFGLTSIKALPHMSNILSSINSLKFSKKATDYYNKNLNFNKEFKKNLMQNHSKFEKFEFCNVAFKYPNKNEYLFKDLSVSFKLGETIEVKGATGVGKSTLIDIILGLQTPQKFKFKIDNVIQNLPKDWLKNFSYVPQSIYLFDTSIKKNIILEDDEKNFNKELFLKCLKLAKVDDFIYKLPNKEDTLIGELGSYLSGGQKQRIGIARAIYKNSPIVIFDEATNALDKETEKKIYENLFAFFKDKIFIIINHRDMNEYKVLKKITLN